MTNEKKLKEIFYRSAKTLTLAMRAASISEIFVFHLNVKCTLDTPWVRVSVCAHVWVNSAFNSVSQHFSAYGLFFKTIQWTTPALL